MFSRPGWFEVIFLAVFIILAHAFIWHNEGRLDDLEIRITTFETVRIEYVAPTDDSG